jgi:glycosyltransferase involved in cell wall biosynthesis
MKYDVTIGIPVFKSKDFIRRSLESALSQSYQSIEFLIIDDAGKDGTMDFVHQMVEEHPRGKNIHIITHDTNQGVSASRNHIIEQAKGDYLFFMDSDDIIADNTIALMMQQIQSIDAEICFGSYEKIELSGSRTICQYPFARFIGEDQLAIFAYRKFGGIQASACNYLVKTSLLRDNNLRFINVNYWEDLVFTFNLVTLISSAVLLPNITYTYICREGSLSHYQVRTYISKEETLHIIDAIDYLKECSLLLYNKVYFPNRCFIIVMTDFYVACNIIKRRKDIQPSFLDKEIRALMTHPASFRQICSFKQSRKKNLALYLIGRLPSFYCVRFIWIIGKMKKLI